MDKWNALLHGCSDGMTVLSYGLPWLFLAGIVVAVLTKFLRDRAEERRNRIFRRIDPVSCDEFARRCEGRADVRQTVTVNAGFTPWYTPVHPPEEGVEFEVYRKDLLRMVDGDLTLDEFVDIWRGRKVKKRPAVKAEATQPTLEIFHHIQGTFIKGLLKEWGIHLKAKGDPETFTGMYLEWMRDPEDYVAREFTTAFANFIQTKDWFQVLAVIWGYIPEDLKPAFLTEEAMKFFEKFRADITQRIREYWEGWLLVEKAEKGSGHVHSWINDGHGQDRCPCGIPHPSGVVRPWKPSLVEKYTPGAWVRVRRRTSPAVGLLGRISKVLEHEIRVEVWDTEGNSFFIGLSDGEFDYPAYPKTGEWWKMSKCVKPTCKDDPFDQNKEFISGPFEMKVDVVPGDPHVVRVRCGCLEPVNFWRGL